MQGTVGTGGCLFSFPFTLAHGLQRTYHFCISQTWINLAIFLGNSWSHTKMSHQHLNSMPKRFCYFYKQAPQLLIDLLHADLMKISQHLLSSDSERAGAKHSAVLKISGVASVWKQGKFIFPVLREDLVIVLLCCRQGRTRVLALLSSVGAALLESGGDTL